MSLARDRAKIQRGERGRQNQPGFEQSAAETLSRGRIPFVLFLVGVVLLIVLGKFNFSRLTMDELRRYSSGIMRGRIRYRPAGAEDRMMNVRQRAGSILLLFCALLIAGGAIAKKVPPASPLDLNTATAAQLTRLPGIGATTAKAIVQFRQKSGPFERVNDLLAIRGISSRKLERIRPYVTVSTAGPRRPSSSRESKIVSA